MFFGVALDVAVSGVEGAEQSALRIAVKFGIVDMAHGFDGEAAGFLSAFVSAHAVGDYGEAALAAEFVVGVGLPVEVGVLVIGTLAADVGQARDLDPGFCVATVNRHS